MDTIYNLSFPEKAVAKGLVEIIDVYGGNYFTIALDGVVIDSVYKDSYETTVVKRKFIKDCCKKAKVTEEELEFVLIDWYYFANKVLPDYDSNDYLDVYAPFLDVIQQYGVVPSKFVSYVAKGITELEESI